MDLYRTLIKQIRRLPVDLVTLGKLKAVVKQEFKSPEFSRKNCIKYIKIMNEILLDSKYTKIPTILDLIYKDMEGCQVYKDHYKMIYKFVNYNYDQLRSSYPQLHLFKVLKVPEPYLDSFDRILAEESLKDLNISSKNSTIPLIHGKAATTNPDLSGIKTLYGFLRSHDISSRKLPPMEALYPSNKFGKPLHIIQRDKILHARINDLKNTVLTYKPIPKKNLDHLNQTTRVPNLNPGFFKYMHRSDKLVPYEKKILKVYKMYLMDQFYIEEGVYKMNPMNFYE